MLKNVDFKKVELKKVIDDSVVRADLIAKKETPKQTKSTKTGKVKKIDNSSQVNIMDKSLSPLNENENENENQKSDKKKDNTEKKPAKKPAKKTYKKTEQKPEQPVKIESPLNKENNNDTPKFRCQSKKIFITIKDKQEEDYINYINGKYAVHKWVYGNEIGESAYIHTHLAIEFEKMQDIQNSKVFDYKNIHPNFSSVKNWRHCELYCIKDGDYKANYKINAMTQLIDNICDHTNVIDAIKENATDIRDIIPIMNVFNNRRATYSDALIKEISNCVYSGWHFKLLPILEDNANKRYVIWIYDKKGNTRKTLFCDKYELENIDNCITISCTGSMRDIADVIRNWKEEMNNDPRTILLDYPRTASDKESIYTVLESVKNGCITCTKFKGKRIRFVRPHVVVFSNWLPELDTSISNDRWQVYEIQNDDIVPMTLLEIEIQREIDDEELKQKQEKKRNRFEQIREGVKSGLSRSEILKQLEQEGGEDDPYKFYKDPKMYKTNKLKEQFNKLQDTDLKKESDEPIYIDGFETDDTDLEEDDEPTN